MEEEVKAGIDKFKAACAEKLPAIKIVIPVRATGGAFLVSFTHEGERTYGTIAEDDFADWGEEQNLESMQKLVTSFIEKLLTKPS
jgi:hypothetical protein